MKTPTYEDYLAILAPLARLCGKLLAIRGVKLYLDPRRMVSQ